MVHHLRRSPKWEDTLTCTCETISLQAGCTNEKCLHRKHVQRLPAVVSTPERGVVAICSNIPDVKPYADWVDQLAQPLVSLPLLLKRYMLFRDTNSQGTQKKREQLYSLLLLLLKGYYQRI